MKDTLLFRTCELVIPIIELLEACCFSVTALHERSHEELSSLFKAAKVPFIVASEAEIANTLRGFTPCQQKATLVMVSVIEHRALTVTIM